MTKRFTITVVANPNKLVIPAYVVNDTDYDQVELTMNSIARKNGGIVMTSCVNAWADDGSWKDIAATITKRDGRFIGSVTVRFDV